MRKRHPVLLSFLAIISTLQISCATNPGTTTSEETLSWLSVSGNKIVDKNGTEMALKGIALADPYSLDTEGKWSESYFQKAAEWGAKLVRIPVHPKYWRENTSKHLDYLDQGLSWSKKYNMYAIIDWHSIGNVVSGSFETSWGGIYITTTTETYSFWSTLSSRYQNSPEAAFYEIFNEPAYISWEVWKGVAETIIDIIYQNNPKAIPVVGGVDWAYDLRGVSSEPVSKSGIAYAIHPYPQHPSTSWDTYFGFAKEKYPVVATEFGFDPAAEGKHYQATTEYGTQIIDYLNNKKISWTVWCFHPTWYPNLITDWNYTPSTSGTLFKQYLK